MKTLKERVIELKNEIRQRIIDGDFELNGIEDDASYGYLNSINISIDGLNFKFSISKDKTYLSQHKGPVIIDWNGYEIGDLKHLYGPIEDQELQYKKEQIKKLQDEVRALQTK